MIGTSHEINEDFSTFLEEGKSDEMIKFLAEIANVSEKDTIINTISEGSTIIDCVVSANSPEQAESLKLSISKASYPFPIISSSYGVFTS